MNAQGQIDRYVAASVSGENDQPMLKRLVTFYLWVRSGACLIRDISARLVPMVFRQAQLRVLRRAMRQAARGRPVRIIVGKSRKTGVSTLVQALFVFLSSVYGLQAAVTLTHTSKATQDIFGIAVRVARHWVARPPTEGVGGKRELFWNDIDSCYTSGTAGGTAVGAGGTPSALHLSEVAKWRDTSKSDTELNATTAVPDDPNTIIIYESTFVGRDLFWTRFRDARDGKTRYEAEFIAWWLDPTLGEEPGPGFKRKPAEDKIALRAARDGVEMTDEMLAWRRAKIAEIGEAYFRQEYPATPEEAIQATKGLILGEIIRDTFITKLPFDPRQVHVDSLQLVGGIDFGFIHPTVIWSAYLWAGQLFVFQCARMFESVAEDQVAGLVSRGTYYCDPSGRGYREELSAAAVKVNLRVILEQAPRTVAAGEDIQTFEMRALVQAIESKRLFILVCEETQTEELLDEAESLSWNEKTGKPDMGQGTADGHFDMIMGLKYLVMGALTGGKVKARTVGCKPAGKGRSFRV